MQVPENIDEIVDKCVNDIWKQFDKDGNGVIDKVEFKTMIRELLDQEIKDEG